MKTKLIHKIQRVAEGAKISGQYLYAKREATEYIKELSSFLKVSRQECIFFCVLFVVNSKNRTTDLSDIAEHLEAETLDIFHSIPTIYSLEKKRLIVQESRRMRHTVKSESILEAYFAIPRKVLEGTIAGPNTFLHAEKKKDLFDILNAVDSLVDERDDEDITTEELNDEIENILVDSQTIPFALKVQSLNLHHDEKTLLLYICSETIRGNESVCLKDACDKIFDSLADNFSVRRGIIKGSYDLIRKNICKTESGSLRSENNIYLTDQSIDLLFEEEKDVISIKRTDKGIIEPEAIKKENLFYNKEISDRIALIQRSLEEVNYRKLMTQLKNNNLTEGLTMLFYGPPGTGKTASTYMLAEKTGRAVIPVEISSAKSMWYGESQKIIKGIFENYKSSLKKRKVAPILLFNECDAILSRRRSLAGSSEVNQTENAIQNIILEEMEEFEGIMIATTNLTQNLDEAFERRFLYKLLFDQPDHQTLSKIWKSFFPWLKANEAGQIAAMHNMSGGNIQNISKKMNIEELFNNKKADLDLLLELCEEEKGFEEECSSIGYLK